jgi:hypothetical protein
MVWLLTNEFDKLGDLGFIVIFTTLEGIEFFFLNLY